MGDHGPDYQMSLTFYIIRDTDTGEYQSNRDSRLWGPLSEAAIHRNPKNAAKSIKGENQSRAFMREHNPNDLKYHRLNAEVVPCSVDVVGGTPNEPLYSSQEEAHAAFGAVFQHYKGGVYRALEIRNGVAMMEHLWPHPRSTHHRPVSELLNDFITEIDACRFEPVTGWARSLIVDNLANTE